MDSEQWIGIAKITLVVSKVMFIILTFCATSKLVVSDLTVPDNFIIDILGKSISITLLILQLIYLMLNCGISLELMTLIRCYIAVLILSWILYLVPIGKFIQGIIIAYISYGSCTAIILFLCAYNMPVVNRNRFLKIIKKAYFSWDFVPHAHVDEL